MIKSDLATVVVKASTKNYQKGRGGKKVCKITPHHVAGVLTAEQIGNIFQNPKRVASSNYGIGNDGTIACYVGEENRAYTSSSRSNDEQAITIEVSNCERGGQWRISDAAWKSLVALCVDICKRYNFKLEYDGTPNGSLTKHKMFAATACPGPYLESKFEELARVVNAQLEEKPVPSEPTSGYLVKVTVPVLNIREKPGTNYAVVGQIRDKGIYTIVEESDGKGASKWGKLKSGAGWISLDFVERQTSGTVPVAKKKSNEEIADEVIAGKWGVGKDREKRLTEAGYDYKAIQKIVNKKMK